MSDPPDKAYLLDEPSEAVFELLDKPSLPLRIVKWGFRFILVAIPAAILYFAVLITPLRVMNSEFDKTLPGWLTPFPISGSLAYYGFAIWLLLILFADRSHSSKRVEEAKRKLIEGVIKGLLNRQKTGPPALLYKWLVKSFRTTNGNDAVAEFCEVAGVKIENDVKTTEIARHYKDGKKTATDYLCVINAHAKNSFLASVEDAFEYFSKYDRQHNPRDRITRIFSVPLTLQEEPGATVADWHSWKETQRQALFAALWVNKVAGVDTKLHLFSPGNDYNDFFEKADYVICFDPAANDSPETQKLVFLAFPSNEKKCLKISGSPELYSVFEHEFYLRTTEGYDRSRTNDMIVLFTRDGYSDLLGALDVSQSFASEVLTRLRVHVETLGQAARSLWLPRIERWIEFT